MVISSHQHRPSSSSVSSAHLVNAHSPHQPSHPHHSSTYNPHLHKHGNYHVSTSSGRSAMSRANKPAKDPKKQFKRRGSDLIRKISNKDRYAIFLEPVDLKQVPHYADVIKRPMDLSLVQKNLDMGVYRTPMEMRADLDLIWSNCFTFNSDQTVFCREAVRLRALSTRYYDDLIRLLISDGVAAALGIQQPETNLTTPSGLAIPNAINSNANNSSSANFSNSNELNPHQSQFSYPATSASASNLSSFATHPQSLKRPSSGPLPDHASVSLPPNGNSIIPHSEEKDAGLAARRIQQVRRAKQDLKAAVEAAAVARAEVTQTARKAGVTVPPSLTDRDESDDTSELTAAKQIFSGPSNILKKKAELLKLYQSPQEFPIINGNPMLRDSVQQIPKAWSRIGRMHPGLPPPALSRARARDFRNGRKYEAYVRKFAPSARRLLATVLDASVVEQMDKKHKRMADMGCGKRRRYEDNDDDVNDKKMASSGSRVKAESVLVDDESRQIFSADHTLLAELVGEKRARKAARILTKKEKEVEQDLQSKESSPQLGEENIRQLGALLKSKGVSTDLLDTLTAPSTGKIESEDCDTTLSGHEIGGSDHEMDELLSANYQGMLNCLRLRALRDSVNEAEREKVEDRERECVERVAKGVGRAISQIAPKTLLHQVDATENTLNFCTATSSNHQGSTSVSK